MNLPQENFDDAVRSGRPTLESLIGHGHTGRIDLARSGTTALRTFMWDLEAIQAAVRLELMNRDEKPTDFG